jgi:DNA polymerase III subunit epsilon
MKESFTHQLNLDRPLAFFDLETTGINLTRDRIIQISILKALPGGNHTQRTWLVNPELPIPLESTMVHGIKDEDVVDQPTFAELSQEIQMYLDDCDLAGFNILRFDLPLLVEEFVRNNVSFSLDDRKIVDAQKIFHLMEPRNLSAAFKFYCGAPMTSLGSAHSADVDTLATFMVLDAQVKHYSGQSVESEENSQAIVLENDMSQLHDLTVGRTVDLAGRMYFNDQKEILFAFGKYKDLAVKEVFLRKDPSYYSWIMNSDFPADTKSWVTKIHREIKGNQGQNSASSTK